LFGADRCIPLATIAHNRSDVGVRLDIVDQCWRAPQSCLRWIRRPWSRTATFAFNGRDQSRLFTADKRTRPEPQFNLEAEGGVGDAVSQKSELLGLLDGSTQALDRQRIFCADIDKSAVSSDCVSRNRHSLEHPLRVALEHAAIHECARVTFIGIA